MWARIKGKAENTLLRLPFKGVYNFSNFLTKPTRGQKRVKGSYYLVVGLYPLFSLFFPGLSLSDVGKAMIQCVRRGAPKGVLEVPDIRALLAS